MWTWTLSFLLLVGCGEDAPTEGTISKPTAPDQPEAAEPVAEDLMPLSERLSKDNGFRDATMGRPRSDFKNLQRRKKWDVPEEGTRAWAKKGEYLLVGAATVEKIVYRFQDDRLFSVTLSSEDLIHCSTLRDVFTEMYGPGNKGTAGFDQTVWWGVDVQLIFTSMIDCSAEYSWRSARQKLLDAATAPIGTTKTQDAADEAERALEGRPGDAEEPE